MKLRRVNKTQFTNALVCSRCLRPGAIKRTGMHMACYLESKKDKKKKEKQP